MNARQLPAADYLALKGASRELVRRVGSSVMAERLTRVRQQAFSEYGSPDEARFMPIDVVADLEAEVGPVITRTLAELSNCILVPLPEGAAAGAVADRTGRSAKEFGDVMARVCDALGDGRISADEARSIGREIRELMLELCALAEAVKAATQKGDDDVH